MRATQPTDEGVRPCAYGLLALTPALSRMRERGRGSAP